MWPFRRNKPGRKKRKHGRLEKVVAGMIIGGAIGSIVGKTTLDRHRNLEDEE